MQESKRLGIGRPNGSVPDATLQRQFARRVALDVDNPQILTASLNIVDCSRQLPPVWGETARFDIDVGGSGRSNLPTLPIHPYQLRAAGEALIREGPAARNREVGAAGGPERVNSVNDGHGFPGEPQGSGIKSLRQEIARPDVHEITRTWIG